MDYRNLPVARRTRSRVDQMYRDCHENIKKKKLKIGGGAESVSQSESSFKADESVVRVDCRADSTVAEEESVDAGVKDKGKSTVSEGIDKTMPIRLDVSDDGEGDDDDVVYRGEKNDLSARGDVVIFIDDEDVLGESSSFCSDNVGENGGLNCDGELHCGVATHEGSSNDDDEEEEEELDECSDDLVVFSSEEDNDDSDDKDYSSNEEEVEDTGSSSSEEDEEENYVRDSGGMERGSDKGRKLERVEMLSSSSEGEKGKEEDDQLEVAASLCDDRGKLRRVVEESGMRKSEELDALVDSDSAKDNEPNENSSVNELHCVAKRTRSHFVSECRKKNVERGTASNPFFIDMEDRDSSTTLGDDDENGENDDDNVDDEETCHRVCKTGSGRGNDGKILHTVSKKDKGNSGKSKRKQNSLMKDQNVEEILLNSILDGEEIPLEDSPVSRSEVLMKERSESDDETILPMKFYFGYEEPTPPEKSEFEKEMDNLWTEMDFALAASAMGSTEPSKRDKNEVEPAPEIEHNQTTCCAHGKHQLILDEEIGIICKHCCFVQLEIRYVMPSFAQNSGERSRRDSKFEDDGDLHFQDYGFDSQSGLESCSQAEGTVWDLVPGVKRSMYPHQREGFEFIWRNIAGGIDLAKLKQSTLSGDGNGCIISHAPGTGKTRLAIVFLQSYMKLYPACRPVIVAPCNMLLTWEEEFRKWKTGIVFHNLNNPVLTGKELLELQNPSKSLSRTMKLFSWEKGGSVLGISYTRFKMIVRGSKNGNNKSGKMHEQMRKIILELPSLFFLDEGHIPRNYQTDMFKALSEIRTEKRIILSGTPFQNNFDELFNTFYLVNRKFADGMRPRNIRDSVTSRGRKRKEEKGRWTSLTSSIGKVAEDRLADEKKLDELRTIIAPFVHVHKGTVLQDNLPGLRQSVVVLRPFDLQKQILEEGVQSETDMIKKNSFVSLVSAHPYLLLESCKNEEFKNSWRPELERLRLNSEAGTKMKFLMDLLRLSEALNEKVLVFSIFLKPLNLIVDQLRESFNWIEGREVLYMDGKQDVRLRQSSINIFNDPLSKVKVLLASKEACSEGINLVGASRLVLLDLHWNPSVDTQAISRAYRLGQKRFVHVYRLVTSRTIEEDKCIRQAKKDWLSKSVFFSSDGEGSYRKTSSSATKDKILEEMVHLDKLKYIENIEEYDESKLNNSFGFWEMGSKSL